MKQTAMLVLALLALIGLAMAGHAWSAGTTATGEVTDALGKNFEMPSVALIDAGANVGLLLLGSWFAGLLFKRLGMPSITGYLCFGMLVGPSILGLVTKDAVGVLTLVNDLAVAMIALTAGAELRFKELRGSVRSVIILAFAFVFGIGAVTVLGAPFLLGGLNGVGSGEGMTSVWVVGLLAAPILVANSPAVILALMNETGSSSAMIKISLAVTVCKDLLLVVLFAVVITLGLSMVGGGETEGSALAASLTSKVPGSIVAGLLVGLAMAWYLRKINAHLPVFIVFSCFGIAIVSGLLGFEALIVALIAGVLMENAYPDRSESLFEAVNDLSLPVYCVFFSVAGAKLDLGALGPVAFAAMGLVVLRIGSVWVISWLGTMVTKQSVPVRRWLWSAFLPQAGVSLALAAIVAQEFGDQEWAKGFYTLMLAVIAFHELVGPMILKLGIARSEDQEDAST